MAFKHRLWADLETRSAVPINEGTHRYVEGVEIILFLYALDDGPVQVWEPLSGPMPSDLHGWLEDPTVELAFHNVAFDRTVLMACGYGEKYWLPGSRFLCTMTAARMVRLPGGLDALCRALGVPEAYAKRDGNALIKKFCIPRADGTYTSPTDDAQAWKRFVDYGVHDVVAMRECMKRIPNVMNEVERILYAHTMNMNERGIQIDRKLAVSCALSAADYKKRFKNHAVQVAGDAEFNVISQQALLAYFKSYGVELPDARQATLEEFLDSEQAGLLPWEVTEIMRTRLRANKAAVAKFPAVLKRLNRDDRLRGVVVHAGAGNTHRDSAQGAQFQNLARPVLLNKKLTMEDACEIAKAGTAEMFFDDPMQLLSDCARGMIIPAPGKKLCVADLSNIEGRSVVWLAGEQWKLQYFRDFDAGKIKFDNYVAAYAKAFNISPADVDSTQRAIGKAMELGLGYGGGVGAFLTFAAIYRVDLDKMARAVRESGDAAMWADCEGAYDWFVEKQMDYGLSKETWTGCYYLVKAWRAAHPAVVAMWQRSEEALKNAIQHPKVWFEAARDCHFYNDGGWVFARMPSGRTMIFPMAKVDEKGVTYMGVNSFTKKFGVQRTYGGRLCIAEGTLVLTEQDGWIPIERVNSRHRVWDGVEWVHTDGAIFNGYKEVIESYGVHMTADHKVLTEAGWKSASQSKGLDRAACRLPDGVEIPRIGRQEKSLGDPMRLWGRAVDACKRVQTRSVLRLQNAGNSSRSTQDTRHESASSVCSVEVNARSLQDSNASSVEKLRRAWYSSVRTVAGIVRELLGRHGTNVSIWSSVGPQGQQRFVFAGELSLGDVQRKQQQPAEYIVDGQSVGTYARNQTVGVDRHRAFNSAVPAEPRDNGTRSDTKTGSRSKVYDLTNCGPRSRFTVWGDGAPLIVHNCENFTQSFARDVLFWNIPTIEQHGYPIVMRIHDEFITEPPNEDRFSGEHLAALMSRTQKWCEDLPLAAVGEDLMRYQKT